MQIIKHIKTVAIILLTLTIVACNETDQSITVDREPTDKLIAQLGNKDYSIVLNDMDIRDQSGVKRFQHKYNVLKVENDTLLVDSLDWKTVNRAYFEKHENDLGMEIVSHHNGKLSREAQPVGFGWAIGNEKYGSWEEATKDSTSTTSSTRTRRWRSNGTGFLFWYWMMRRPAYQNNYNGYRSAASRGASYYGNMSNGSTQYGTRSNYQKSKRPSFFTRKRSSSTWNSFKSNKAKRSSSRYKSASSTRSRSGGIGK
ncbi:hypothetical protein [Nonlabens sp.]|uniref:hypothetical protein n=1 Tax=Nonlabens sp. TaxID=1888209 RepID=UPI003F69CE4B